MHDIGDDDVDLCFGTDATQDLDDSVFYSQQQQQNQKQQQQNQSGSQRKPLTPPNVSPLLSYKDQVSHQEAHFEFKWTKEMLINDFGVTNWPASLPACLIFCKSYKYIRLLKSKQKSFFLLQNKFLISHFSC